MKYLFLCMVLFVSMKADTYSDFLNHFNKQEYENACRVGKKILSSTQGNEKIISSIAQSCMKCDYMQALSLAQHTLRESKDGRADAVAFSSVLLQQKLIYQFMYDDTNISTLFLPIVEHPLSHTFVAIRNGAYETLSSNPKVITFKKDNSHYKVFIDKADRGRVIIEITDAKGKKEKRRYL